MVTPAVVRDAIVDDRLFGFDVKSIVVDGMKFYVAASIFKHFGGIVFSQVFRDTYGKRFPQLRETLVKYDRLRDYVQHAMTQNRLKNKTRLMELINKHEEPALEIPRGVNDGIIDIPKTVTVDAQQFKENAQALGLHAVMKLLMEMGFVPVAPAETGKPRVIKVTIEY